jgi:hypothetical protein
MIAGISRRRDISAFYVFIAENPPERGGALIRTKPRAITLRHLFPWENLFPMNSCFCPLLPGREAGFDISGLVE